MRTLWLAALLVASVVACNAQRATPVSGTPAVGDAASKALAMLPRTKGSLTDIYVVEVNNVTGKPTPVPPWNTPHNGAYQLDVATGAITCVNGKTTTTPETTKAPNIYCAKTNFPAPRGVAVDAGGNVYVADNVSNGVYKSSYDAKSRRWSTACVLPGVSLQTCGSKFDAPYGIALDANGNLYVAEKTSPGSVLKIPLSSGMVGCVTGTISTNTPYVCSGSQIPPAFGVAADGASAADVYVASSQSNAVFKITPAGAITCVAGTTSVPPSQSQNYGCSGTGFSDPYGVAVAPDCQSSCTVFVADTENQEVKMVPSGGTPSIIGSGFDQPHGLAVSRQGKNVYVADSNHGAIWKISGFSSTSPGTMKCIPTTKLPCNGTTVRPGGAGFFHDNAVALYYAEK